MSEKGQGQDDDGFTTVDKRRGNRRGNRRDQGNVGTQSDNSGQPGGHQQGRTREPQRSEGSGGWPRQGGNNHGNVSGWTSNSGRPGGYEQGNTRGTHRGEGSGRGQGQGGRDAGYGQGGRGGGFGQGGRGGGFGQGGRGGGFGQGGRGGGSGRGGQNQDGCREADIYSPEQTLPPPDPSVSKTEDSIQHGLSRMKLPNISRLNLSNDPPTRPSYGTGGQEVTLWANYVEMIPPPDLILYRYHITIKPPAVGRKGEQIVRLLLRRPGLAELSRDLVTDFRSTLISRKRLESSEYRFAYRGENEDEPPRDPKDYTVTVEVNGTLSVAQLTAFLTSTDPDSVCSEKLPIIQALNILVRHYVKSNRNLAAIGSTKTYRITDSVTEFDLGGGLVALRGFFSSVRAATCRILVNVNVSHGAFYTAVPLPDLMLSHGTNIDKLRSFLHKLRVTVNHLPKRKNKSGEPILRVRTISGLATRRDGLGLDKPPRVSFDGAPPDKVEFFLDNSTESSNQKGGKAKGAQKGASKGDPWANTAQARYVTVSDYFQEKYKKNFRYSNFPVVNLGTVQKPMYRPAEVCDVLPGQAYRSMLDGEQTRKMVEHAARKPKLNANSIVREGLDTVGLVSPTNKVLENFGISVTPNLITVPGRILAPPQVRYHTGYGQVLSGSWNMKANTLNAGGTLGTWAVLTIIKNGVKQPGFRHREITPAEAFRNCMKEMGITANSKAIDHEITVNHNKDPEIDKEIQNISKSARFLVVLLPVKDSELFKHIKRVGDIKVGIPTICVLREKFCKDSSTLAQKQYFSNVALKLNLKLGGTNQLVPDMGIISEDKTMVVGIDVTHPSPGSAGNAPSVAGMAASVDSRLGQWPAALEIQRGRQEMVDDLAEMLKSRLRLWMLRHQQSYPENILVYRDGVSEGQYASVIESELPLLRRACAETYPADLTKRGLPRMTIVIVGKRHHTRFYPTHHEKNADKYANPKPGTVVDRGVTEARNWDFFLQAHAAIQGTARPAHYFVILDEIFKHRYSGNAANELEKLTHQLCYMHGRATRAVKVCMPAYYADLVCDRARQYLSQVYDNPGNDGPENLPQAPVETVRVHPDLRDSMFYI